MIADIETAGHLVQEAHTKQICIEKLLREIGQQGIDVSTERAIEVEIDKLSFECKEIYEKLDKIADDAINNAKARTPETIASLVDYAHQQISDWLQCEGCEIDIDAASHIFRRLQGILAIARDALAEKVQKH